MLFRSCRVAALSLPQGGRNAISHTIGRASPRGRSRSAWPRAAFREGAARRPSGSDLPSVASSHPPGMLLQQSRLHGRVAALSLPQGGRNAISHTIGRAPLRERRSHSIGLAARAPAARNEAEQRTDHHVRNGMHCPPLHRSSQQESLQPGPSSQGLGLSISPLPATAEAFP